MPRNPKCRKICLTPSCRMFQGASDQAAVELRLDELEALRLVDLEEFDQAKAAEHMEISRGTLQRLLYAAHRRVALALTTGRSIAIAENGNAVPAPECRSFSTCRFCCRSSETAAKLKTQGETMIIAVTCENDNVFQHFGHTPSFALFTVEENRLTGRTDLPTGESGHGALAGLLKEHNVDVLICGGIGGGARSALAEAGIQLYPGASGSADAQVEALLAGSLAYDPNTVCSHHDHGEGHTCGHHHEGGHTCGGHDHGCGHHG